MTNIYAAIAIVVAKIFSIISLMVICMLLQ